MYPLTESWDFDALAPPLSFDDRWSLLELLPARQRECLDLLFLAHEDQRLNVIS